MLNHRKQSLGLSMVELLVGMTVGLVVLVSVGAVFVNNVKSQNDTLKLTKLNQNMRILIDVMAKDIRRAGYLTSYVPENRTQLNDNPFFQTANDITVHNSGGCIVYSYNRNDDTEFNTALSGGGAVLNTTAVNDNERLGFRLSGTALQMRASGTSNTSCTNGDWQAVNEPEIEITNLQFALTNGSTLNVTSMYNDSDGDGCKDGDDAAPTVASSTCKTSAPPWGNGLCDAGEPCNTCTRDGAPDPACLVVRNVTIQMTGRLKSDTAVMQTLTHVVRVRNDQFLPALP